MTSNTTQSLIGHVDPLGIFLSRYQKNTLPHGWLLTGPQGIGKGLFAYHAAWFLLQPNSSTPPDFRTISREDSTFRKMQSGSHPDFLLITPGGGDEDSTQKNIVVDQIRKIESFVRSTPACGKWKVIIIDPADAMNTNASNALLKVLEEPSPGVVFFLISHKPTALLDTIKSRCCPLKFDVLSEADLGTIFEEPPSPLLQAFAQGRPGRIHETTLYQGEKLLELIVSAFSDILSSPSHLTGAHALAKQVDKLDPEAQNYFYDMLLWVIQQLILRDTTREDAFLQIPQLHPLKALLPMDYSYPLLTAQKKITELLRSQKLINLDTRHTILNIFLLLQEAFHG